jgi:hypothetical protein
LALERLTAEFGMGSGLITPPKATRPAKDRYEAKLVLIEFDMFDGH